MYARVLRQILAAKRPFFASAARAFTKPRQILSCGIPSIRAITTASGGMLARGRKMASSVARRALWFIGCSGLALCTATSIATAEERRIIATAAPAFEQLDRNSDDRLSRTEAGYNRHLLDIFVDSDVDGDGFVTRSEYEAATRRIVVSEARR